MSKKVRQLRVTGSAGANSDINVTPLVDVVLVLLIIFMVVTPLLEKDIPVRTPSAEKVEQIAEVPPDQIVIYINRKGDMRLNNDHVTTGDYVPRLKQILDVKAPIDKVVFIVADDELNYGKLVTV